MSQSHSPTIQMKDDDDQIHFYTGLPSYIAFTTLLSLLSSVMPSSEQCETTRVSKIFHHWIDTKFTQLSPFKMARLRNNPCTVHFQTVLSHCILVPPALSAAPKYLYNGQVLYQQELRLIPTINITIL